MNEMNRLIEIMSEMLAEQREMKTTFTARFDQVDARLDRIEARLDRLEARMDRLEARMDKLEGEVKELKRDISILKYKVDDVDKTLDTMLNFEQRISKLEEAVFGKAS